MGQGPWSLETWRVTRGVDAACEQCGQKLFSATGQFASCSLLLRALPQSGNSVRAENSHQAVSPAHREGSRCLGRAHHLALGSRVRSMDDPASLLQRKLLRQQAPLSNSSSVRGFASLLISTPMVPQELTIPQQNDPKNKEL